jgi:hypothetical protein
MQRKASTASVEKLKLLLLSHAKRGTIAL